MSHPTGPFGGRRQTYYVPGPSSDTTLRSVEYVKIIDVVCEGEIEGLADGGKSVYIDGVPLQNPDSISQGNVVEGSTNFEEVNFQLKTGSQDQDYLRGFPSSEAEQSIGNPEILAGTPVVVSTESSNLTSLRLNIRIPRLTRTDSTTGHIYGTQVQYTIELQSNTSGFFVLQPSGAAYKSLAPTGDTEATTTVDVVGFEGVVQWTHAFHDPGDGDYNNHWIDYDVEYSVSGSGVWKLVENFRRTHSTDGRTDTFGGKFLLSGLPEATYELRVVNVVGTTELWGYGSVKFAYLHEWVPSSTVKIIGKSVSTYTLSHLIDLTQLGLDDGPWQVRVTRLTADSTSDLLQNKTFFDSYTEIVDHKLSYPNTALIGVELDSTQFGSVPSRAYELKLLKIKIPTNYDPIAKTYDGLWDGTFKVAWSDNPAWCFYDLVTNTRYGLGAFIDETLVDKSSLYTISQYCDELVTTGEGSQEPRFTCNMYLQNREEAYKVLNNMVSVFRGMLYWNTNQLIPIQDSLKTVSAQFTNADVVEGSFSYEGSGSKTRHTVALVTWNDPENAYKQAIEYVEDSSAVALRGIFETEIIAIGCTSRSQANRVGRWLLYTERYETETITFKTSFEGTQVAPGDVIKTSDQHRVGARYGGRITAVTAGTLTLDSPLTSGAGETFTITNVLSDGVLVDSTITDGEGTYTTVSISPSFTTQPTVNSLWVVASNVVSPEEWRVIAVVEEEKNIYGITALKYNSSKYSYVEDGLKLEQKQSSLITTTQAHITNLTTEDSLYLINNNILGSRLEVSWDKPRGAIKYTVSYTLGDGNSESGSTITTNYEILNVPSGSYSITVIAYNSIGTASAPVTITGTTLGTTVTPSDVSNFTIIVNGLTSFLSWDAVTEPSLAYYQLRFSPDISGATWESSTLLVERVGRDNTTATVSKLIGTYFIKTVSISDTFNTTATSLVQISSPAASDPTIAGWNLVDTFSEDPNFDGVVDGSRMYIAGALNSTVYEYALGTNYDVKTATFTTGDSFSVLSEVPSPQAMRFNLTGTRIFVLSLAGAVYQYDLDTAWDVSTAVYTASNTFSVVTQEATPRAMAFSPDGMGMFIAGTTNNTVYKYTLTTAWDITSTQAFVTGQLYDVSGKETSVRGLSFSPDGTKMYVVGFSYKTVFMWELPTAWDIATTAAWATGDGWLVSPQDGNPEDLDFSSEGSTLYILGDGTNTAYMYDIPTPWDISTITTFTAGDLIAVGTEENTPYSLTFSRPYIKAAGSTLKLSNPDVVTSAEYALSNTVDVGAVYPAQFVIDLDISAETVSSFMSEWSTLSTVTILSGTVVDPTLASVELQIRTTNTDPTDSPTWSAWQAFVVGDYNNRAFEFKAILNTEDSNITPLVTGLDIYLSMIDRVVGEKDVLSVAGDFYDATDDASGSAHGLYFSSLGTYVYMLAGDYVDQYTLATPWDLVTAVYKTRVFINPAGGYTTWYRGLAFSSDGKQMYVTNIQLTDVIYRYNLTTAWELSSATYSGQSKAFNDELVTAMDIAFSTLGDKLFVLDTNLDRVVVWDLSTLWDIRSSSATYAGDAAGYDISPPSSSGAGLHFSIDGTKMYIVDTDDRDALEYTLSTAWDLTSATHESANDVDLVLQGASGIGIYVSPDGSKLYYLSSGDSIYRYDLPTNHSFAGTVNDGVLGAILIPDLAPASLHLSADGKHLYHVVDDTPDAVNQYDLTEAYKLNTGSYNQKYETVAGETIVNSVAFNDVGDKMYVLGGTDDEIKEYSLSTAWDVSSASIATATLDVSLEETSPYSMYFKPDGAAVFVYGFINDKISKYDLSPAWDLDSATFNANESSPTLVDPYQIANGLEFSSNGLYLFVTTASGTARGVYRFALANAWDVSDILMDKYYDAYANDYTAGAEDIAISPDGFHMYVMVDLNAESIIELILRTPWDIDTATLAGSVITYAVPFHIIPAIAIASHNLTEGDYYEISNKTVSGFHIVFKKSSGSPVRRTFDYIAKGY